MESEFPKLPKKLPAQTILKSLPAYLKEPANYEKIQRAIYEAGASTCNHAEIAEWGKCKKCQLKAWNRKEMLYRLGFRSGTQYLMWKRTHERIRSLRRDRLPKYNT